MKPAKKRVKRSKRARKESSGFLTKIEQLLYSKKDQQAFLEDFSTLVDDGVPANKAVEVMYKISTGSTKKLCKDVLDEIAQGHPIANGLVKWFPNHIVELVKAGEQGGTLAQNLRSGGEAMGRSNEAIASLFGSLTYPIVVLLAGLAVLVYINNSIFIQFEDIKPITAWPLQGQNLVAMAEFVEQWWWTVAIGFVIFVIILYRVLRDFTGSGRIIMDSLPIISIYREATAARFMETMGLLIANGVVFKLALSITKQQANAYLKWHILNMEKRLSIGRGNIAEVLDTKLLSKADILRLKAIADAKGFEHALIRLGRLAAMNAVATISKFGKVLGGILLALGAALAGYMVTGIYAVGSSLT